MIYSALHLPDFIIHDSLSTLYKTFANSYDINWKLYTVENVELKRGSLCKKSKILLEME